MLWMRTSAAWAVALLLATMGDAMAAQASLKYIGSQPEQGSSQAVVVGEVPLVHTAQLLPRGSDGQIAGGDAAAQTRVLLDLLEAVLKPAGSGLDQLVRLNVYTTNLAAAKAARQVLSERLPSSALPAVTWATGKLADPAALVALDAVAATSTDTTRAVKLWRHKLATGAGAAAATLPPGQKIYISGQAEPGTMAEATRLTLESLDRTLQFLQVDRSHVVQVKSFLGPMSDVDVVRAEMKKFFGDATPPLVFVEWESNLPIEIEMVAAGKADARAAADIEFLTPPGMKASPVYCRVARFTSPQVIYIAGLTGEPNTSGEAQVRKIFADLKSVLDQTSSDLKNLAKATYYVSDDAPSTKLNEIRPEFYDPQRPPAASKAMVAGVGWQGRTIAVDMIAVGSERARD